MKQAYGLRTVAVYEAAKGALVLVAGFGLLSLLQHDVQHFAEQLVAHLHLNPAKGYPRIFIDATTKVTDTRLWLFAVFALVYAAVRWVEAYGLWLGKRWAEWFAVASGGIYVPAEVYEIMRRVSWTKIMLLTINACIVAYMIYVLWRSKRNRMEPRDEKGAS
jgi:uncharacterized membrane protein (DUF2068 family)